MSIRCNSSENCIDRYDYFLARENCIEQGFTLIELVLVLTLIAVISTAVSVKFQSTATYTIGTQADWLQRNVSHAQSLALRWEQPLQITVTSTQYSITCGTPISGSPCVTLGDVVRDPNSRQLQTFVLQDSVTMTGSNFLFDAMGRPCTTTCVSPATTNLITTNRVLTLTGGGKTYTLTVSPLTGFSSLVGS